jgi:hypothetical protein
VSPQAVSSPDANPEMNYFCLAGAPDPWAGEERFYEKREIDFHSAKELIHAL